MKTIEIAKKEIDYKALKKRYVDESNLGQIIKDDTIITNNGKPVILYINLKNEQTKYLRQACKNIKFAENTRTAGLKTRSAIFGYNPRNAIRKDYCSSTAMSYNSPNEHAVFCQFAEYLESIYEKYFPETYKEHLELSRKEILKDWRLSGGAFTSGIVNKNNRLKYHFDSGNFEGVLSNMVAFKKNCSGGYLHLPEYDCSLEIADNSLSVFDGQQILHGVSKFNAGINGYRYSVVYYTLKQMWNCEPLSDEILRARKKHLKREKNRAAEKTGEKDLRTKDN